MAIAPTTADCAVAVRPYPGHVECGDYGLVREHGAGLFMALIDALGHGPRAAQVVQQARGFLERCEASDVVAVMKGLHEHVRGTRGLVAGLAWLDVPSGDLRYAGIGNITAKVYGEQPAEFISRSGVVGYAMPAPKEVRHTLTDGDVLVLHTDGLPRHLNGRPGSQLLSGDANAIAAQLIGGFAKEADDAGCLVMRYSQ